MEVRLQKYLAEIGIASRRAAEKMIEAGKIKVNGEVITMQGVKIDPEKDQIEVEGKKVSAHKELKYYMLNKPVQYVTTASDEKGRETVIDLLPTTIRVYPIGRLDYMSSGLLLLTNDGDLTYKLTHPKHDIPKKYIATIEPKVYEEDIEMLKKGVDLELYKTSDCEIRLVKEDFTTQTYEVVLHEGKNRQIRRMFDHIGSRVIHLRRIAIGNLRLDQLELGTYRELTAEEIVYLKSL